VVVIAKKVHVLNPVPLPARFLNQSGTDFCGQPAVMSACSRHANDKKRYKRATIKQRRATALAVAGSLIAAYRQAY